MNTNKEYNDLIAEAKQNVTPERNCIHHIIPVSVGGEDTEDNRVGLTPTEHYLAHYYLAQANPDNYSIVHAYIYLRRLHPFSVGDDEFYESIKDDHYRRHSAVAKERWSDPSFKSAAKERWNSPEYRNIMKEANQRHVYVTEVGVFSSATEAGVALGISREMVRKRANNPDKPVLKVPVDEYNPAIHKL